MTGDARFFSENPHLFESLTNVFQDTLKFSKRSATKLLYAQQIWDSLARDWHTGSNLLLWHVLKYWAMIAQAGYHDESVSREFAEYSRGMRNDIERYLVGRGPLGPRFFEGANLDGVDWLDCRKHEEPWSGGRAGPTSPAWAAALAGAASELEVAARLRQIGSLADLDGSIWWWPYCLTNVSNVADVRRPTALFTDKVGRAGIAV